MLGFTIEGPLLHLPSVCVPILRALPEWFGLEEAILEYEREIEHLPTFLAKANGSVLGFLSLKQHNPFSAEVFVMGVQPDAHRRGIGRALVEAAESYSRGRGTEYMQVKTLAASRPSQEYACTRAFYEALGFRPLEEFPRIWDEDNPCLVMVKRL
jgi:ribosomal protein S18 acetylase RimI-like enzyme